MHGAQVAFEIGKREMLTQEIRDILGMGPPPEPIVDNIYEDLDDDDDKAADKADERMDGDGDDDDEPQIDEEDSDMEEDKGTVV